VPLLVRRWSTTAIVCLPRLIVPADAPKAVPLATMITVFKENAVGFGATPRGHGDAHCARSISGHKPG